LQGVILAEPAGRQLRQVNDIELRELGGEAIKDLAGAIGRAVVDERDFETRIVELDE
jgi:hypothetical protein